MGIGEEESGERIGRGLRVEVKEPREIYRQIRLKGPRFMIQYDQILDAVCSTLSTDLVYFDSQSQLNPNTYSFESQINFTGRRPSELSLSRGYISEEQAKKLAHFLRAAGISRVRINPPQKFVQSASFLFQNSSYELHFDPNSNLSVTQQVEYLEENKGFILNSRYYECPADLGAQGMLVFPSQIEPFAKVYELVLKGLYNVFNQPEPNKILVLGPRAIP